jgi:hypothetical protein
MWYVCNIIQICCTHVNFKDNSWIWFQAQSFNSQPCPFWQEKQPPGPGAWRGELRLWFLRGFPKFRHGGWLFHVIPWYFDSKFWTAMGLTWFDPAFNIKQSAFRRLPSYTFGWSDPHLNERWKKLHSTRHQVEKISSAICLANSASEEAVHFDGNRIL